MQNIPADRPDTDLKLAKISGIQSFGHSSDGFCSIGQRKSRDKPLVEILERETYTISCVIGQFYIRVAHRARYYMPCLGVRRIYQPVSRTDRTSTPISLLKI